MSWNINNISINVSWKWIKGLQLFFLVPSFAELNIHSMLTHCPWQRVPAADAKCEHKSWAFTSPGADVASATWTHQNQAVISHVSAHTTEWVRWLGLYWLWRFWLDNMHAGQWTFHWCELDRWQKYNEGKRFEICYIKLNGISKYFFQGQFSIFSHFFKEIQEFRPQSTGLRKKKWWCKKAWNYEWNHFCFCILEHL